MGTGPKSQRNCELSASARQRARNWVDRAPEPPLGSSMTQRDVKLIPHGVSLDDACKRRFAAIGDPEDLTDAERAQFDAEFRGLGLIP
jgi:hypothetical protein